MKTIRIVILTLIFTAALNAQWVQQVSGTGLYLADSWMFSSDKVIACGDEGIILKTTNGGNNWNQMQSNSTEFLAHMFFLNENTGWIAGNDSLHKTIDGGNTWTGISGTSDWNICFIDGSTGWMAGGNSYIKKTTNGGVNWTFTMLPNPSISTSISFINSNTGFALGSRPVQDSSVIYKTTNGGSNWVVLHRDNQIYHSMYVMNESNLFFCGIEGVFTKTNDGGQSWGGINTPGSESLNKLVFTDALSGYICGDYGELYATSDGGASWQTQSMVTGESFQSITFLQGNSQVGYVVGTSGLICKTTNGGVIGINQISTEIPQGFSLEQNYPNPFNPVTNIKFSIPKSGNVKLVIYDISGREVRRLVDQNLNAGYYNSDFNAANLASGVYFYRLEAKDFTDVKKMILIK